jgi:hypothetical protein
MFWKIIDRSTNLVFLLLAIVILSKQWNDERSSSEIATEKKVIIDVLDNRTFYMEGRINRVAESSDRYQVNMSRRVDVLEIRQQALEDRKRDNTRIVNTNTNTVGK